MWDSGFAEFKLDYEGTKKLAVSDDYNILSDQISVGGHMWRIEGYLDGDYKANYGVHLSLYLVLLGKSRKVKAIFEAFLMGKDGVPSSLQSKRCVNVYPPEGFNLWGFLHFVKWRDLESDYVVDGQVKIMCGVIVLSDTVNNTIAVPSSDIGEHFGSLLDRSDGSDVSFSVGGEIFPAHRAVLAARSPVFRAQLFGPMADAKMPCITLPDMQPSTFSILLRFMYTDVLTGDDDDEEIGESCSSSKKTDRFLNLLAAADMYNLDRLKLLCAQKLWEGVSAESVASILCCAETHGCQELKSRCLDFFVADENFKVAVLTEGYYRLMQSSPSVIDEIRARVQS